MKSLAMIGIVLFIGGCALPGKPDQSAGDVGKSIACLVQPAVPGALASPRERSCWHRIEGETLLIGNELFSIAIDRRTGVIREIHNRANDQRYPVQGDQTGAVVRVNQGPAREWMADGQTTHRFDIAFAKSKDVADVHCLSLTERLEGMTVEIVYQLRPDHFWIERQLRFDAGGRPMRFDRLVYGRLDVPGATSRTLELGRFDRPRLQLRGTDGVFGGVGFWFYSVGEDGLYFNEADATARTEFTSEPWYAGIIQSEPGEPWPGWLWYKTYLEQSKAETDRQRAWCYWNSGWGQWGIDLNDPGGPPYIDLAARLGVRSICFGGFLGEIPEYIQVAADDPAARTNMERLKQRNVKVGILVGTGGIDYADKKVMQERLGDMDRFVQAGFHDYHCDFFKTTDTLTAHRNVADFFRAARERLDYTECHLGMAVYGPQFQRQVLINHPDDLEGFDTSRFSSDWATFLGFRHNRAHWQRKYDYLMPESGLYYFLTHYANWGHKRRYADPEWCQFLYRPHAYCGIAYNFHDTIGYRTSVAAASAFSPYYVFGHLELRMPERDVAFTRAWLDWVEANAAALRPARICAETEDYCVVSKLRGRQGLIYVLNYSPGARDFMLTPPGGFGRGRVRPVYPSREDARAWSESAPLAVRVPGESLAILDVNGSLANMPPENPSEFPIDVAFEPAGAGVWTAQFKMPGGGQATAGDDPNLPRRLRNVDEYFDQEAPSPDLDYEVAMVKKLGRGRLPERFKRLYEFDQEGAAETWKFAPWAYADRIWLVCRPSRPLPIAGEMPALEVNGRPAPLVPRVDYRTGTAAEWENWTCPLFFADLTAAAAVGGEINLRLTGPNSLSLDHCYVTTARNRQ